MEEKESPFSEESMEKMFSNMGNYMVNKLKNKSISLKKKIEEVKNSDKKNKEEIIKKFLELIEVTEKIAEKTEEQTKTQKELLSLMESMSKIDNELDNLLVENGK